VADDLTEHPLHRNLRALDEPVVDAAIVSTLQEVLALAEAGEVTAVAMIVANRDGSWSQRISGDTRYHSLAGLNLRVDILKQLLLRQIEVVGK
jgi:hypothetical protein